MDSLYILNPEGNDGEGRVTRYVGRGNAILEHIQLIDLLIAANRAAVAIVEEATANDEEFADISEPAAVASRVRAVLVLQATNN